MQPETAPVLTNTKTRNNFTKCADEPSRHEFQLSLRRNAARPISRPGCAANRQSACRWRLCPRRANGTRTAFQPNPSFREENYRDRVVHAMPSVLIVHKPDMRLCKLDAHLEHKVEFGFGILGVPLDKTTLSLAREEVSGGQWTTTKLRVHLDGSFLLLKTISRDVDSLRHGFKPVAPDLTVAEAAAIIRSNAF